MTFRSLTALVLGLATSATAWSQADPGYIEQQQHMAMLHVIDLVESWLETTGVPGGVIAVVEEGNTLLLEGFGLADAETGKPVHRVTTIFRVGDLAQAMTATAVLQLVDRGVLGLKTSVFEFPGLESLVPDSPKPISPAQLLLHTAGIDNRAIATRARSESDLSGLKPYLEARMPPQVRPSGVVSVPSAHGYALVGRLVEVVSGEVFDSYLHRAVFTPLAMNHSALVEARLPADRIATGYRRRDGQLRVVSPDYPQTVPASTLLTSGADMANWMRAILAGGSLDGHRLLDTKSVDLLLERQFAHHESLPGRTLAFREGSHLSPRELYIASLGNGFSAVLVLLPQRRLGLFAAFNREIDLWGLTHQILGPFGTPRSTEEPASGSAQDSSDSELTGFWQDAAAPMATVEKLVTLVRQDRIRLDADGALRWRGRSFAPAGSGCYLQPEELTRFCFVDGPDQTRYASIGNLTLEKLSWYESRPVQMSLWVAFTALFLAVGWPRAALPTRHVALRPDDSFPPRWPLSLARIAAAVNFVFIASLAVVLATEMRFGATTLLYAVPLGLLAVLCLPLVAGALTLVAAVGLGAIWRSSRSSLAIRLRFTGLILALSAFLPFLWGWNLLGFHL